MQRELTSENCSYAIVFAKDSCPQWIYSDDHKSKHQQLIIFKNKEKKLRLRIT